MTERYVLDASAAIDFVESGPGMRKVDQLLHAAALEQTNIFHVGHESRRGLLLLWRKRSEEQARQTLDGLSRLPIQIVPVIFHRLSSRRTPKRSTRFLTLIASRLPLPYSIAPPWSPAIATSRNSGAIFRCYGSRVPELRRGGC